jgi:hypothetical protein
MIDEDDDVFSKCDQCGGQVKRENGCSLCLNCGFSKCG